MKGNLGPETESFVACYDEFYFVIYLSSSLCGDKLRIKVPSGYADYVFLAFSSPSLELINEILDEDCAL